MPTGFNCLNWGLARLTADTDKAVRPSMEGVEDEQSLNEVLYLWLALHELVQEGGEREVPQGVAIIGDVGARQEGPGKGRHAGVHVTPQTRQLPPTRPVPSTELWLPAASPNALTFSVYATLAAGAAATPCCKGCNMTILLIIGIMTCRGYGLGLARLGVQFSMA